MEKNLKISTVIHKMLAVEARIEDKKIGCFAEELIIEGLIKRGVEKAKKEIKKA
jgi:hypothetical protein